MTVNADAPLDKRGQFIPARRRALFDALLDCEALGRENREVMEQLYRLLTATVHYEHLARREDLHDAYHHLNPSTRTSPQLPAGYDAAYAAMTEALDDVLQSANFVELSPEEIEAARRERGRLRYTVRAAVSEFRSIRMFWRGQHVDQVEHRTFWGLRKIRHTVEAYDEVILFAALKPTPPPQGRFRRMPPIAAPGSVMIKAFHDIARGDLDTLLPRARVVMNNTDFLVMGVPALLGGIPILLRLAPALLVLSGLISVYLGSTGPRPDSVGEALLVASALVALGGFLMNQWVKYERRALRYQQAVNDKLYFRNVTNNVGVVDHIIGMAEEQDCKEALLAYGILLERGPMTEDALDTAIEAFLLERFELDVDFEVTDALRKLADFGLLKRNGACLSVPKPDDALVALDRRWDNLFRFAQAGHPLSSKPSA